MVFAKIKVIGRVQGVFFRHNTCQKAKQLGITGYVSNLPDGSVYIEASGAKEKLLNLIEWVKSSPGASEVEKIELTWEKTPANKKLQKFKII